MDESHQLTSTADEITQPFFYNLSHIEQETGITQ